MSVFTPLVFENEEEFNRKLVEFSMNTEKWIKSASALYKEIVQGDCILGIEDEKLHRSVNVIQVKCFYTNEQGEQFQLIEVKQVFKNGTIRERGHKFLAEKLQIGESPEQGALRGLFEELQISDVKVVPIPTENSFKKQESLTYIGLSCSYNTYVFSCEIPKSLYKSSYIENQDDKDTFFEWYKL